MALFKFCWWINASILGKRAPKRIYLRFSGRFPESLTETVLQTWRYTVVLLNKKLFSPVQCIEKAISESNLWVVHLSGPYRKIRTTTGTNQNSPFYRGPIQPYNKWLYRLFTGPYFPWDFRDSNASIELPPSLLEDTGASVLGPRWNYCQEIFAP